MICPECKDDFEPKRPHQRFCSNSCRVNNFAGSDGGLRGTVSAVRKCKGDVVSVTLRFPVSEALDALRLGIGQPIEVVK